MEPPDATLIGPTVDEMATFTDLQAVLAWAGITEEEARARFFDAFGNTTRVVAMFSATLVRSAMSSYEASGATLREQASAMLAL